VLLSLATRHPALERIGRLVLTNCDSYDQFPPDALKRAATLSRALPRLARSLVRLQLRSSAARRKLAFSVTAGGLDDTHAASFFGPARRDPRIAGDLIAAMAGFRPQLLLDAADALPRFDHPVLLIWGDSCDFFPIAHAQRLASDLPSATLIRVPGAKTWVPIDNPLAVADGIAGFVPSLRGTFIRP
jgi:pimeloyl-ACP methyl ester carboxylesterase